MEIERLWQKMYQATLYYGREGAVIQAMAGIDLALWDIKGKALKMPVWQVIGARYRDRLRVYASNMMQFTPEANAERVRKAKGEGFTAAKFGWEPFGKDAKTDCLFLDAMRKAAGDEFDLMLDVGLVWDATTTIQRAKLFEPFNLFWIEEPLPPDDLAGYRKVSQHILPAAGRRRGGVHLSRLPAADRRGRHRPGPDRHDPLRHQPVAQDRRVCAQRGIPVANHNFTTDINTAASLHFLAAVPNALVLEYCVEPSEISRALARNPIKLEDGCMRVPEEPGLGVEPDMEIVEKYLVRD